MRRHIWYIFALFLCLRIVLAFRLPIFNDESIYMRWGAGFLQDPSHWWAWTLDGKQPAVAITFGIFQMLPFDPLISMRLASILWSCVTFFSLYLLSSSDLLRGSVLSSTNDSRLRGNDKLSIYALLLLTFCPYLILFDTLAMSESVITALFSVLLFLALSLIHRPKVWKGLAIGIFVAVGWWYKTTILLAIPLIFLTLIRTRTKWISQWKKTGTGLALGWFVGFSMITPVLFNPNLEYGTTMSYIPRVLTLQQVLAFPVGQWLVNWSAILQWCIGYGAGVLFLLWVVALWRFRKNPRTQIIAVWILIPLAFEAFLVPSLAGRLIAMIIPPMIISVADYFSRIQKTIALYCMIPVIVSGVIVSSMPNTFFSLLTPLPAAKADFSQYVAGWTSGYGVKEAIGRVRQENMRSPVVVFVRLDGGNPEDAVVSYMMRAGIPYFYLEELLDVSKDPVLSKAPWYFISRGNQFGEYRTRMVEVVKFKKPLDDEFVGVYEIKKNMLP